MSRAKTIARRGAGLRKRWLLGALVLVLLVSTARTASAETPYAEAGRRALEWTRRLVDLGPRPVGSSAHQKQQEIIVNELQRLGCAIAEEEFTARTPKGPVQMKNIIAKFPGASEKVVVISGHYDTYHRPGLRFVGANDGGSSAGFLLALAEELRRKPKRNSVWLVFFDGEESIRNWQDKDHTYGSRHQVETWQSQGILARIKAVINVDMIGDADLDLVYEGYSTPWLRDLIWRLGNELGYANAFSRRTPSYIEDDHRPFLEAGVPAVDLIDFHYGPANRYWHTEEDTLDKLSPRSFAVMLHVVAELLQKLEGK